jgi:hypothetical protein
MPKLMQQVLVMDSARKLNYFPPRGATSHFYSSRMIMHKEVLDYEKHCVFSFGTYVQAHDENDPTNSLKPRASKIQGGHEIKEFDDRSSNKTKVGDHDSNDSTHY